MDLPLIKNAYDFTDEAKDSSDPVSVLYSKRIIMLSGAITQMTAQVVTAALLSLDELSHAPIQLVINSQGGSVSDGLAIIDTMALIASPVTTIVNGLAASMATVIASAGSPRYATPHSEFLIHQIFVPEAGGTMQDLRIQTQHAEATNIVLMSLLAKNCKLISAAEQSAIEADPSLQTLAPEAKQTFTRFLTENDRDHILSAQQALAYHLVDKIIGLGTKKKAKQ